MKLRDCSDYSVHSLTYPTNPIGTFACNYTYDHHLNPDCPLRVNIGRMSNNSYDHQMCSSN